MAIYPATRNPGYPGRTLVVSWYGFALYLLAWFTENVKTTDFSKSVGKLFPHPVGDYTRRKGLVFSTSTKIKILILDSPKGDYTRRHSGQGSSFPGIT